MFLIDALGVPLVLDIVVVTVVGAPLLSVVCSVVQHRCVLYPNGCARWYSHGPLQFRGVLYTM